MNSDSQAGHTAVRRCFSFCLPPPPPPLFFFSFFFQEGGGGGAALFFLEGEVSDIIRTDITVMVNWALKSS